MVRLELNHGYSHRTSSRLAATLGSKSTLKRLTKKSVLTADISHLCDMVAAPAEPLALRLSSNLMVGIARVYKRKLKRTYLNKC